MFLKQGMSVLTFRMSSHNVYYHPNLHLDVKQ